MTSEFFVDEPIQQVGVQAPMQEQDPVVPSIPVRDYQSATLRFVGGSKLEHADFIYTPTDAAFNALPENTLARDSHWYYRKQGGQKSYFGKRSEMLIEVAGVRAYVDERMRETDPIFVDAKAGEGLPFTPMPSDRDPKLLYKKGREIQFLTAGRVANKDVEAGGSASLLADVSEGDEIDWTILNYNSPVSSIETPDASYETKGKIVLVKAIQLDGTARQFVVPDEAAISAAIIALRDDLLKKQAAISEDVRTKHEEQSGQIAELQRRDDAFEKRVLANENNISEYGKSISENSRQLEFLLEIAHVPAFDFPIVVTNGTDSASVVLQNRYTVIYGWDWFTKDGNGEYTIPISKQIGRPVQRDDGTWYFAARYEQGSQVPTGLFAVEIRGSVKAVIDPA